MSATAPAPVAASASTVIAAKLNKGPGAIGMIAFGIVLIIGVIFIGYSLAHDLAGLELGSSLPYILLGTALFVALGGGWWSDRAQAAAKQ